jgi:hypothetical protein
LSKNAKKRGKNSDFWGVKRGSKCKNVNFGGFWTRFLEPQPIKPLFKAVLGGRKRFKTSNCSKNLRQSPRKFRGGPVQGGYPGGEASFGGFGGQKFVFSKNSQKFCQKSVKNVKNEGGQKMSFSHKKFDNCQNLP